jgi:hypothetical protein
MVSNSSAVAMMRPFSKPYVRCGLGLVGRKKEGFPNRKGSFDDLEVLFQGFRITIRDPETWSRLVLPFPTDGANCTCQEVR